MVGIAIIPPTEDTLSAGAGLYARHCVSCHGPDGFGGGDVGNALDPSPALLAFMLQMPHTADSYLMWSIAEGGAAFGSEMPAYKDVLTEAQIWRIITFMRRGFSVE